MLLPWLALAAFQGGRATEHLTRAAWRSLLLCQPHDTLCGCSIVGNENVGALSFGFDLSDPSQYGGAEEDFWRALHDGRNKAGEFLYPAMPYTNYTKVTREDSDAMFAVIRVPPDAELPDERVESGDRGLGLARLDLRDVRGRDPDSASELANADLLAEPGQ